MEMSKYKAELHKRANVQPCSNDLLIFFPPICHLVCFTFQGEKLIELKCIYLPGATRSFHLSRQKML